MQFCRALRAGEAPAPGITPSEHASDINIQQEAGFRPRNAEVLGLPLCWIPDSFKHSTVVSISSCAVICPAPCFDANNAPTRGSPQEVSATPGVAQWGRQLRSLWTTSTAVKDKTARSRSRPQPRLLPNAINQAALSCLITGAAGPNWQEMSKEINKVRKGTGRGDTFSAVVCLCRSCF